MPAEGSDTHFEFTSFWADANNKVIPDLIDFTRTFFARHTLLNVLTRYCIFTSENMLMVMRPYQQDQRHLSKSEFETVLSGSECVRRPVEDTVLRNLQLECLRKAVDGLGTQGRELIELRYGQGLTMEEIGTIYGVSKAAVSKRLKKLHEQLRGSVK